MLAVCGLAAAAATPPPPAAKATASPAAAAPAGDWPGLWGPHRDGQPGGTLHVEPGITAREVWRRPAGKGYSEVAVVDGTGYLLFSDGTNDHLSAFTLTTGKETWHMPLGATYRGHGGSDDGPISTPLVSGERVFVLNPWGKLFAFERASGKELWSKDLTAELGAVAPYWGFATSPLLVGDKLIVQAGGAESNNLVALDAATGALRWSSQPAKENGYSSPIFATLAGVPQIIGATTDKIFGVKPEDGTVLWTHPAIGEPRQSPIVMPGDRLFVTCWEQSAMLAVKQEGGAFQVEELWKKPVFKATFSPTLFRDGYLYGINANYLVVLVAETGEEKWRYKLYNSSMILIDGHLAAVGERSGNFYLIAATPEGYQEELQVPVFTAGARSITGPMFVGGRFLLRNGEEMVLLELVQQGPRPPPAEAGGPPAPSTTPGSPEKP